jgi:hypothetical protein
MGSNKVVLGNRIRNVILGDPDPSLQASSPWNTSELGKSPVTPSPRSMTAVSLALLSATSHHTLLACMFTAPQGNPDWPWRFSAAIAMYSGSNALVANNLVDKATSESKTDVAGFKNVPFPYDNRSVVRLRAHILLPAA